MAITQKSVSTIDDDINAEREWGERERVGTRGGVGSYYQPRAEIPSRAPFMAGETGERERERKLQQRQQPPPGSRAGRDRMRSEVPHGSRLVCQD